MFMRLRVSRPAPASRTTDSVAWKTTRIFCGKVERSWVLRLAPRRASTGSACEAEPRGRGSEERAGEQRQQQSKGQHGQGRRCVDGNELRAVEGERDDQLDAEVGDDQARDAAKDGENDAFGQRLADETAARCSEGETDGGLRAARRSSRQQEIGDICAGDEQDEATDPEQDA